MKRTNVLIIICIITSLLYWYTYPSLENFLVYSGSRLAQGALWAPVTTLFVHFDPVHLIGNMVFLYVFGNVVEENADAKMTMPTSNRNNGVFGLTTNKNKMAVTTPNQALLEKVRHKLVSIKIQEHARIVLLPLSRFP